ncbi:CoA transferase [Achromobacter veterisilvae]|uniref:2-methylfumaryl-CoA isomerase n=1 Tax=Achromobacter veterisilvae TaxID=2069367 RepID=A0A446CQJ3_9BURK|nr:CoA transferase [Achromobacter veterisilvae]SSW70111.1 2-methylfumaryl-CoA isomerase [Achromobacter veterisilvae]
MSQPFLRGVRVIESSAFIAAPLAGMTLAQYGADVVRIDMIGGGIDYGRLPRMPEGRSLYWTGLNKGKRSVAVDIRRPEGRELVQALVSAPGEQGGVLLTNIGVPWLSHDALARQRADVITCTIEGHADGSTAVDYTVNCATGLPAMTGNGSEQAPVNSVLPAWDIACAYQAAFAISAAVQGRAVTGTGAQMRLALSDVAFATMSHLGYLAEAELLHVDRPALGNFLYGAFGKDFGARDGRRLYVAAISLGQWKALVAACGLQEAVRRIEAATGLNLDDEGDRYAAREAIAAEIVPWCAARSLETIGQRFTEQKVCWGTYRTVRQAVAQDPRLGSANPVFQTVHTAGVGRHLAAGGAVRLMGVPHPPVVPAPMLGQHTDEVLADVLGLGDAAIGRLLALGIVAGPAQDPLMAG